MLTHFLIWFPTMIVVMIAMDVWAGLLHGLIWHGSLWFIHRTHHVRRAPGERFELNDTLAFLHAPVAIVLILWGCCAQPSVAREIAFGVGVGMSLFGFVYLFVHDGLVHGRIPWARFLLRYAFIRKVVRAHVVHHRGAAAPFSLFFGPLELRLRTAASHGKKEELT